MYMLNLVFCSLTHPRERRPRPTLNHEQNQHFARSSLLPDNQVVYLARGLPGSLLAHTCA